MHDVSEGKSAQRVKTKLRGLARVRGGPGTATRAVGLLGAIFTYAVRRGLRPDNPVRGVILLCRRTARAAAERSGIRVVRGRTAGGGSC